MNVSKIKELYAQMFEYMVAKDIAALGALHTDDFVLVHMTGVRQNKQEYLHAIQDGTLNYYSYQNIEILPKTEYTFVGRCLVSAAVYGGSKHTWRLQFEVELTPDYKFRQIVASTY